MTQKVLAGGLPIGGGAPVSVQSMTNTDTRDVPATLAQIRALADAGCDLVRVAVHDEACARAVRALVDGSPVPLCADIHFDYRLAIAALENGIAKVRVNPGNIGGEARVRMVADCAKAHGAPIRVGVNAGSLEKDILAKHGGVTAQGMLESALSHARMLEDCGFSDIVLALKCSDVRLTVDAYRLASRACEYPLHIGLTEAGLPEEGRVRSAVALGALLMDGIGDTIRVSLTGSPLAEPKAALDILRAAGLRRGVTFISCPTCGRTQIDVEGVARAVQTELVGIEKPIRVAVMGCVVNGPGEARDADIALCGGKDAGAVYVKGKFVKKLTGDLAAGFCACVREVLDEL